MPGCIHHGDTEARSHQRRKVDAARGIRILYVAYPLLTVSQESAGGAEQILWTLEHEMARCGVETTVAASAGSQIAGELFNTGEPCRELDDFERRSREHQGKIVELVRRRELEGRPFDLIHDMSGSFWACAASFHTPLLATLHLPRGFYPRHLFENVPENVSFNCVSHIQGFTFADLEAIGAVVPNGIALDQFQSPGAATSGGRSGLLWLGRICEEKAPHLALEIAQRSGMAITIAGQLYPFSYHRDYFDREVAPRVNQIAGSTFIQAPTLETKCRLLREAQAVVISSQAQETSSLVAMEAAAAGTPVIAFARGALKEVIEHGMTGFLVNDIEEAVQALQRVKAGEITGEACIRHARKHFSSAAMARRYAALYSQIKSGKRVPAAVQG
jgi:glycosyltransferase involved in cell wall biosynthesis